MPKLPVAAEVLEADPSWGASLLGPTRAQQAYFDARMAEDRGAAPRSRNAGLLMIAVGAVATVLLLNQGILVLVGPMIVFFAMIPLVFSLQPKSDRLANCRRWGLYERGAVCPGALNGPAGILLPWGTVIHVWFRTSAQAGWEFHIKAEPIRIGTINQYILTHRFGMDALEAARFPERVLSVIRKFVPESRITLG